MVFVGTPEEQAAATRIQARQRTLAAKRERERKRQAAIKLQSRYRGFNARKEAKETKRRDTETRVLDEARRNRQLRLQRREQEYKLLKERPAGEVDGWERDREDKAAVTVQAYWKGRQAKQTFRPARERRDQAASTIQRKYRSRQGRTPRSAREAGGRRGAAGNLDGIDVDDDLSLRESTASESRAGLSEADRRTILQSQVDKKRAQWLAANPEPPSLSEMQDATDKVDALFATYRSGKSTSELRARELKRTQREAALLYTRLQQAERTLPATGKLGDFPGPRGAALEAARADHARSLAEARAHGKWWKGLKELGGEPLGGGDPRDPLADWDGAIAGLERKWEKLESAERERPTIAM